MNRRQPDSSPAAARTTRRGFLGATVAAGLAVPALGAASRPAPRRGGKLLILGGTRFLGPALVAAAQARGFEVTLFNRGKSNPQLFPDLQKLRGDRDTGDLDALKKGQWDAVIDTSGYVPAHVDATATLLRDRVEHYGFVSTISVYPDQSAELISEDTETATVDAETLAKTKTIRESFRHYGAMKALCEQAAEKAMPGRVANVRPGLIVGPDDNSDRFTYWPVRVRRGGEVLAPGNPDQEVQFIDVRDLAEFCVQLGADKKGGVWNAVGFPSMTLSIQELLHACKGTFNSDCAFTWVNEDFLRENKVRPYMEMPLWLPAGQRGHVDVRRAAADGLACRPVVDTARDTVAWYDGRWPEGRPWGRAGMKAERETALLQAWHAR